MKPVEIEFLVKDNTRSGLTGVSTGIDGVGKDADKTQQKIKNIEEEIARLSSAAAKNAGDIDQLKVLNKQLEEARQKLENIRKTSQKTNLVPPSAPQAIRTYNGLNVSVQQMARELPSLAMGPQMFFMAISNNLPIFTDELARARKEFEATTAAGGKGVPVWRQLLKSIVSWQTLLAVGITLAVTYGKEIGNWVKSLFSGKEAFDAAGVAAEKFHATMVAGARNAQAEVIKLNLLYRAATDNARSMNERRIAAEKLQSLYPEYFSNLNNEQIMLGKANEKYKELVNNVYEYAKAQAAFKNLVAVAEQQQTLGGASSLDSYIRAYRTVQAAEKRKQAADDVYSALPWYKGGNATPEYKESVNAGAWLLNTRRDEKMYSERIREELKSLPNGEEIIKIIDDKFGGSIGAYIDALEAEGKRLTDIATDTQIKANPTGARGSSGLAGDSTDQLKKQLDDDLQRQEQELTQLTIAKLEEGAEKEREQIRLNYKNKIDEYREQEKQLLAVIAKLRQSGAKVDPNVEGQIKANTSTQIAMAKDMEARELEKVNDQTVQREKEYLEELLKEYETYEEAKLRIIKEYNAQIAYLEEKGEKDNAAIAAEERDKALAALKAKYGDVYKEIFGSVSKMTRKQINESLALAKEALSNAETIEEVKALSEQINNLQDASDNYFSTIETGWPNVYNAFKHLMTAQKEYAKAEEKGDTAAMNYWQEQVEINKEKFTQSLAATGVNTLVSGLQQAGDEMQRLADITGDVDLGSVGAQISAAAQTLGAAAQGFASGGWVGAIVGGVTDIINQTIEGIVHVKTYIAELEQDMLEYSNAVKLASLKVNDDDYDTIFGANRLSKAQDAYKTAQKALEEYNKVVNKSFDETLEEDKKAFLLSDAATLTAFGKETSNQIMQQKAALEKGYTELQAMSIKVKDYTGWQEFWGKQDQYQSLYDFARDLWNDDGSFNVENAKLFLETNDKLTEKQKEQIQNAIDLKEAYDEAMSVVADYLNGVFSEVGDNMTDALISAAEKGTDAFDDMAKSIGQNLREIAKDLINSVAVAPIVKAAQDEMIAILGNENLSEEELVMKWTDVLSQMITDVNNKADVVSVLWDNIEKYAAANKIPLDDTASQQSGQAGAINTVTQESFSRVEGLVTSIQIHTASIDENVGSGIIPLLGQSLDAVNEIRDYCRNLPMMYQLLRRLEQYGIKTK